MTGSVTPYLPDSARAALPLSALQPYPPYLDPRFAQCIDRTRPRVLLDQLDRKGTVRPHHRCSDLLYRYTDTGEEALVPHIWYNQTQDMRIEHWKHSAADVDERLALARKTQDALEASVLRRNPVEPVTANREVRLGRYALADKERLVKKVHDCLAASLSGEFL